MTTYHQQAIKMAAQTPFRLRVKGTSMAPLLQNGDSLIVQPVPLERIKPGDLLTFRRNDEIVTHRLLAIRPTELILMGDNLYALDVPVLPEHILGRVTALQKDDKQKSMQGAGWSLIHPTLAWLGRQSTGQGTNLPPTGWAARIPRAVSWLVRVLARQFLYF